MQKGSSPDICCYLVLTYIMLLIAEPSLFSLLSTRVRIILFLWFMASCHLQHKVHSKENKTTTRLPTSSMWRAGIVSSPSSALFFFSLNSRGVKWRYAPNKTSGPGVTPNSCVKQRPIPWYCQEELWKEEIQRGGMAWSLPSTLLAPGSLWFMDFPKQRLPPDQCVLIATHGSILLEFFLILFSSHL